MLIDTTFVKRRLAATKGRWHVVAKGAGLPHTTVKNVGSGTIKNPTIDTMAALMRYFEDEGRKAA